MTNQSVRSAMLHSANDYDNRGYIASQTSAVEKSSGRNLGWAETRLQL